MKQILLVLALLYFVAPTNAHGFTYCKCRGFNNVNLWLYPSDGVARLIATGLNKDECAKMLSHPPCVEIPFLSPAIHSLNPSELNRCPSTFQVKSRRAPS